MRRSSLGVRVSDGTNDRVVTRYCSDLKFTKVAPGGHQSLSFTMVLPRNTFNDLGPQDRVYVYDNRTGCTVIEGYIENPTPVDGPEGQRYDISAVGGMALANDETRALIYVDRDLGQFEKASNSATAAEAEAGTWINDPSYQRERTSFPGGAVVATGALASAGNYVFERAGMFLGGIRVGDVKSGKTDSGYRTTFAHNAGSFDCADVSQINSTTGFSVVCWATTNFPSGSTNRFALQLRRTGGATTIGDDTTWTDWTDYSVVGQRMDRNGTLLTGSAGLVSATQVLASQVVEDLLGRLLTFCDAGTAQVDATSFGITQLAYYDGTKAADVLSDLAIWEPDYLWEILETTGNGKHRFNYRAWPTTARYSVSIKDGFQQRGSDTDLCNRIVVSWTSPLGFAQTTTVTADDLGLTGLGYPVDELTAQGRIKDADPVTLAEGFGSTANATQIGGQILAEKINPPKAGTIVVRRPVFDALTGHQAMPWEIEPGYLCQVRETGDLLRITQADYDHGTFSTVLTLGTPTLTTDQRTARLARARFSLLGVAA